MTETLRTPARSEVALTDPRVVRALELIWLEASMLDAKTYEAWQELYTDDAVYVIPLERDAESFDDVLNMVYDDKRMRALRVGRMTEGFAMAAVDSAITVRTVSRFLVSRVDDSGVTLRSAQILVAFKRGRHDIWAADVDFEVRLGASAADDRLVRKVVRLVDAADAVPAAGFLL